MSTLTPTLTLAPTPTPTLTLTLTPTLTRTPTLTLTLTPTRYDIMERDWYRYEPSSHECVLPVAPEARHSYCHSYGHSAIVP